VPDRSGILDEKTLSGQIFPDGLLNHYWRGKPTLAEAILDPVVHNAYKRPPR